MFDECCIRATNIFVAREMLFVSVAPSRSRVRFWNGDEDCPYGGQGAHAEAQNDRSADPYAGRAIPGHSCHGRPGRARHHLARRIQPHSDERPGRLTSGF